MFARLARSLRRPASARTSQQQPQQQNMGVEALENRRMMAVSPVIAGSKIKGVNLSNNNISTNSTLITVPFTGNIKIGDQTKIQLRGYALNPLSPNLGQVKKVINVVSAQVIETDVNNDGVKERQYLQITTDKLMRKGGQIIFYEGAIQDDNNDTMAQQTVRTVKGQNKERFTLACRMFIPTDVNKFTSEYFAGASATTTANTAVTEPAATTALDAFLGKKVTAGLITQAQKDAAMTRFASSAAKGTIPDHNLRAALFSLTGTFADGAIGAYLDGNNVTGKPYTIIDFANPEDSSVPVAQTSVRPSDQRLRTIFKTEFRGEPMQALSAWLAHEALHQDNAIGLQEEKFATAVETLVYGQQAITDNGFLASTTKLVRQSNEKLAAFLNSGRAIFPYVGVLDAPNTANDAQGVLAGSKADPDGKGVYASFDNFVERQYLERGAVSQNTAGNALLNTYFTNITTKTAPAGLNFSNNTIAEVDNFQQIIGTRNAIILAGRLRMRLS